MRPRTVLVLSLAILLVAPLVATAVSASRGPTMQEKNYAFVESKLRAEAARHGMQLPDLAKLGTKTVTFDSATGRAVELHQSVRAALTEAVAKFGDADLSAAAGADVAPTVPTLAAGDNIHLYANLRFGDCSPAGNYRGIATAQEVPGQIVPNPLLTPFVAVIVWGGPAFHVKGDGWLIGLHGFMGAPIDANVNTASSAQGAPVGTDLVIGTDSSIDSVAAGQISMSSSSSSIFGICLFSIDLGTIFENGVLAVDGEVVPDNPAGV